LQTKIVFLQSIPLSIICFLSPCFALSPLEYEVNKTHFYVTYFSYCSRLLFSFTFFWMVDHWHSLAYYVYKNKLQSGFTKCVTIDYSTFNYMKSELQIMLEIDFFWWQGCSYFECICATKMKTQSRRMLLVRNVWRCHVQEQPKLRL
jgi:hypothetical protein